MNLCITFEDGEELHLTSIESVRLLKVDVIEVKTFGNTPVAHHYVRGFETNYSVADVRKEWEGMDARG